MMPAIPVNTDNYIRAETVRMFDGTIGVADASNHLAHNRVATPSTSRP